MQCQLGQVHLPMHEWHSSWYNTAIEPPQSFSGCVMVTVS